MSTPLERAQQAVERLARTARLKKAETDDLIAAVQRQDAEFIRSEGHHWSGRPALDLFEIADLVDLSKEA